MAAIAPTPSGTASWIAVSLRKNTGAANRPVTNAASSIHTHACDAANPASPSPAPTSPRASAVR